MSGERDLWREKWHPRRSIAAGPPVATVKPSGAHHETECAMRNFSTAANGGLADLLERPRFEVLPTAGAPDAVAEHLPPGRSVTVSASPRKGLDATLDTSVQLAALGYDVIPHIAARMVADDTHLKDIVDRLHEAGITQHLRPERRRHRARRLPRRGGAAPGPARDGQPVPRGRHHRLPRVPPDDPRRRHHPGDVGQEPLRHRDGQQPDLRRRRRRRLAGPGPRPRRLPPPLAGRAGPGRPGQDARRRHPHRRRRLRPLPR